MRAALRPPTPLALNPIVWPAALALLALCAACAHVPVFQAPLAPLEADASLKLGSGATFLASRGWRAGLEPDAAVLRDPEGELQVAVVEVQGGDADDALERAWARVSPDFDRPPQSRLRPPPRDGWEEILQVDYGARPEERRALVAVARRAGTRWFVVLMDGPQAALDRRGAQALTVLTSLRAPGVEEESFAGRAARPLEGERLMAFEAFLVEAMRQAEVPGLSVALVDGRGVRWVRGLGVRRLGEPAPVTPETRFLIGSTTKALTTLLMAAAVDAGAFGWDTPAVQVLPGFALGDADTTARVRVRDTVCACTGLPRQDLEFLFEWRDSTPESRLEGLAGMRPTTGLGETFQYSNTLVAAGGYLAAHALLPGLPLGEAYDRAMAERVFGPLGMASTTFDFDAVAGLEHAAPHAPDLALRLHPQALEQERGVGSVRPAGAAWSTAGDLGRYASLELGRGALPDGARVVSAAALLARREPQVRITERLSYGLGLFVEDDHGVRLVHHGGNNLGFTSDLFLLPEHGLGLVLLTNAGGANAFRAAVRRRFLELVFDGRELALASLAERLRATREESRKARAGLRQTFGPDEARPLEGRYRAAGLGALTLRLEGQALWADAGEWRSRLAERPRRQGPRLLVLTDPPLAGLELLAEAREGGARLRLPYLQHEYVFERE
ncbi:MAG TPA: serine hydrolase domain-containing protein [Myxococcota bacterium]|nr:serine hydrolase domain-containing protein [Myxococcota bacterium]HRY97164.1 serine hydrolase domain-containing protein [Myxococcota bacterium]HSA20705.1 serine hydrolase domain-containing protein [Myxococcota bacterium]